MKREEIFATLKEIFATVKSVDVKDLDGVGESATLKGDLSLNSIGMLYIVIEIEKRFDVYLQDGELTEFVTVGDVVDYLYSVL